MKKIYKCKHCGEEFFNHYKMSGHIAGYHTEVVISNYKKQKLEFLKRVEEYEKNPTLCKYCDKPLSYLDIKRKKKIFCNHSCAASFSNTGMKRSSIELGNCINCKQKLHRTSSKYCSLKCQQDHQSKERVDDWLKTGVFRSFTGGRAGHANRAKYLINYLLKEQEYKCSLCKIGAIWNNLSLVFVLDHIDGDYRNNKRKNLRLICPNCDSQTSTFKGRNKGNGRKDRYSH